MSSESKLYPDIIEVEQKDNVVILKISPPDDLYYFQGHFPKTSILPGIVQIHWAVYFAKKYLNLDTPIHTGSSLKFTNIILPSKLIFLTIENCKDDSYIKYSYTFEDKSFSNGKLKYKGA